MAEYSINEVASNRECIRNELYGKVSKSLEDSSLTIKRSGLADVQCPDVITKAKAAAAERREQI